MKKFLLASGIAALLTAAGCAQMNAGMNNTVDAVKETSAKVLGAEQQSVEQYEVHHDGRIYVFYDRDLYKSFVQNKFTAYHFTRIAEGPNGETIVFGLTKDDKKKLSGIPSVELYDGKITPASFYGEAIIDGRIYVFDSYPEMVAVRTHHEAAYRLTDIGAGPNGETVVYVLTKDNKKKRPEALMAAYAEKNKG